MVTEERRKEWTGFCSFVFCLFCPSLLFWLISVYNPVDKGEKLAIFLSLLFQLGKWDGIKIERQYVGIFIPLRQVVNCSPHFFFYPGPESANNTLSSKNWTGIPSTRPTQWWRFCSMILSSDESVKSNTHLRISALLVLCSYQRWLTLSKQQTSNTSRRRNSRNGLSTEDVFMLRYIKNGLISGLCIRDQAKIPHFVCGFVLLLGILSGGEKQT